MRSATNLRELWASRIEEYLSTDETMRDFCRRHHISGSRLRYWQAKLRQENQQPSTEKPQWLSLQLNEVATPAPMMVKVGEATIEVRSGFNPALFADVVKALKELC